VSEDSFQRMQQFPVIAALMKELHVAIQKNLSPYARRSKHRQ